RGALGLPVPEVLSRWQLRGAIACEVTSIGLACEVPPIGLAGKVTVGGICAVHGVCAVGLIVTGISIGKCVAVRDEVIAIKGDVAAMPVGPPMSPAPSPAAECGADSRA